MKQGIKVLLGLAIFALTAVTAQAGIIYFEDFDAEAAGAKANGYTTAANPGIHYTDTVGADLFVANYGVQNVAGNGLAANTDVDGSGLVIDLDFKAQNINLWFGNDDPSYSDPGDLAELKLFDGLLQVGMVTVAMNRDDIANQTIGFAGAYFDRAIFTYTDPAGNPYTGRNGAPSTGLIEVVDDITIERVPEPATLALLGLGLVALSTRRRR